MNGFWRKIICQNLVEQSLRLFLLSRSEDKYDDYKPNNHYAGGHGAGRGRGGGEGPHT